MKKLLSLFLCAAMILALAGCAQGGSSSQESAQGEDLLLLITELNRIAAEYSRKKKQAEEQILQLKNQIVELEFQASSLESENRQIQDHITFLRGRL